MLLIAITGPSASGKTMLAHALYSQLLALPDIGNQVVMLQEDSYYRDQSKLSFAERTRTNYDHPQAFEHELLEQHLRSLAAGQAVEVPEYDFTRHTRAATVHRVTPAPILILEGILLLADVRLRALFDVAVYVDTDIETCLERRIVRDTTERGRSRNSVVEQFEATVRPMFHEYIYPMREHADLVATEGGKDQKIIEQLIQQARQHLPDPAQKNQKLSQAESQ